MTKDLVPRPYLPPVPVRRRRESEAAIPRACRWARRDRHVSVPLGVPAGCWACAVTLHGLHAAGPVYGASVIGTAAVAVAAYGFRRWDRAAERVYAVLSAAALSAWMSVAATWGPLDGMAGVVMLAFLAALATAWGIPWWYHYRPRGRKKRKKLTDGYSAFWHYHAGDFGVPGSRVVAVEQAGVVTDIIVQLAPGKQTVAKLRMAIPNIESALSGLEDAGIVPADGGMVSVDAVSASRARVRIRRANPLAERVPWPAELAPRSVHDPYAPAMSEDGEYRTAPQQVSSAVGGRTGSGKSTWQLNRIAALSGCRDALPVLIDLKGGRSGMPVLESGLDVYVITTVAEARVWLRLCEAEILARSSGHYDGHADLHATPECPAVFTIVDETSGLTGAKGDSECSRLAGFVASKGRGLAFFIDFASQYWALHASVSDEETRINLPLRVSFATETNAQGKYILDDQGANSGDLENPGDLLLKLGRKADTVRLRGVDMSHDLFREVAGKNARRVTRPPWVLYCGEQVAIPADPVKGTPAVTFQQWWDTRWERLHPRLRAVSPAARKYLDGLPLSPAVDNPLPTAPPPAPPPAPVPPPAPAPQPAPAAPPPGPPLVRPGAVTELIAQKKARMCDAVGTAPPEGISAADLVAASGLVTSTVYSKMRRLEGAGVVTEVAKGHWAPLADVDVHQALAAVEAGDEVQVARLVKAARHPTRSAV